MAWLPHKRGLQAVLSQYTDVRGCVRVVTVEVAERGVRVERDLLTQQGRKEWARQVEATRARSAKDGE